MKKLQYSILGFIFIPMACLSMAVSTYMLLSAVKNVNVVDKIAATYEDVILSKTDPAAYSQKKLYRQLAEASEYRSKKLSHGFCR